MVSIPSTRGAAVSPSTCHPVPRAARVDGAGKQAVLSGTMHYLWALARMKWVAGVRFLSLPAGCMLGPLPEVLAVAQHVQSGSCHWTAQQQECLLPGGRDPTMSGTRSQCFGMGMAFLVVIQQTGLFPHASSVQ